MFDIFYLLTITWRFFQSFDYQSGSRWNDINAARIMRPRSMSKHLSGGCKEILGTCQSVDM